MVTLWSLYEIAPVEDSDQHEHPPSLIRPFVANYVKSSGSLDTPRIAGAAASLGISESMLGAYVFVMLS